VASGYPGHFKMIFKFCGSFCRAFDPVAASAPELETLLDRPSPSG
jgi:hypothetical protein